MIYAEEVYSGAHDRSVDGMLVYLADRLDRAEAAILALEEKLASK